MRKSIHQTFMDIVNVLKQRSTCCRIQVASIAVKDGRIISTGWNGVTKGSKHCDEIFKITKDYKFYMNKKQLLKKDFMIEHHKFSEENEIHSEINNICSAAKNNISLEGCDLYVSITPCRQCAKAIIAAGIKRVIYEKPYDRDSSPIKFLRDNNVICVQLDKVIVSEAFDKFGYYDLSSEVKYDLYNDFFIMNQGGH